MATVLHPVGLMPGDDIPALILRIAAKKRQPIGTERTHPTHDIFARNRAELDAVVQPRRRISRSAASN
jgi:hypothetical protein